MGGKMTVLVVEPGKAPYIQEIGRSLSELQKVVGGAIEGAYPYDDPVAIICNRDGKLTGMPPNRQLTGLDGIPYDLIHGTFFLAGLGAEELCSLTQEQIRRYQNIFRLPDQDRPKKAHKKEKGEFHER